MKLDKYLANILLILFVVYFSQSLLSIQGSFLGQISGILLIAICLYYFGKCLLIRSNIRGYIIALTIFLIVNAVAAMISSMSTKVIMTASWIEISPFNILKATLLSCLPFFPFYYFALKRVDISNSLKIFFVVFLLRSIIEFFKYKNQIALINDVQTVNNVGYIFVTIFPFIFLFKNKILIGAFMSTIVYCTIMSGKRGAIICVIIGTLVLLYMIMKQLSRRSKIISIAYIFCMMVTIVYVANELLQDNEFLQNRLELTLSGYSSGRDEIYYNSWKYWKDSPSASQIYFGSGYGSSISIFGIAAHNDWLELLLSFGLFGVLIYLPVALLPFKYFLDKNRSLTTRCMILSVAIIWLMQTMFSMAYGSEDNFALSMILGFGLGSITLKKLQNNSLVP